jgi:hypothetical protein
MGLSFLRQLPPQGPTPALVQSNILFIESQPSTMAFSIVSLETELHRQMISLRWFFLMTQSFVCFQKWF